ncbi:DNA-directed RNA polymerase [Natronococcus sp. A-GB1]|jgi:DNA-directed RNA polymerase subunit E'|uniref:DNA-directed RNA polymerase subunit Rpo7 n=1 Tax=Natronococcus amylolyticus DSM 10524 TaxID=1227497 RepID=L9XL74_9EURY|nr:MULTISPECIES: DNA-directed RNA polymerase [Natronococcus]ELY61413.1 DNA-directed RNA polymerase subunit E' [Natronococcus amylolyticus DSM 10524]MDG5758789.1 DNA-directed RNA polymerase [Natronococcus sp. A-GB1]MDG5820078.1 DNA-directed RNA polymerase [Natronococcus sp. A-GB7]
MYKRVKLKDTVEVPPKALGDVSPKLVKQLLQDKLEGRMDEQVGSVVSVTQVHDIGEGAVLPNKPGVYYEAEFDAVTFDPDMQEVVDGTIVEVVEFGAFVGIGPVDGLLHVSQISDEYLAFDGENQQLASNESNRTLGVDDAVRARIVTKSIDERNPRDSKIGLTAKQPGLGKHGWLEEDHEKREAATGE